MQTQLQPINMEGNGEITARQMVAKLFTDDKDFIRVAYHWSSANAVCDTIRSILFIHPEQLDRLFQLVHTLKHGTAAWKFVSKSSDQEPEILSYWGYRVTTCRTCSAFVSELLLRSWQESGKKWSDEYKRYWKNFELLGPGVMANLFETVCTAYERLEKDTKNALEAESHSTSLWDAANEFFGENFQITRSQDAMRLKFLLDTLHQRTTLELLIRLSAKENVECIRENDKKALILQKQWKEYVHAYTAEEEGTNNKSAETPAQGRNRKKNKISAERRKKQRLAIKAGNGQVELVEGPAKAEETADNTAFSTERTDESTNGDESLMPLTTCDQSAQMDNPIPVDLSKTLDLLVSPSVTLDEVDIPNTSDLLTSPSVTLGEVDISKTSDLLASPPVTLDEVDFSKTSDLLASSSVTLNEVEICKSSGISASHTIALDPPDATKSTGPSSAHAEIVNPVKISKTSSISPSSQDLVALLENQTSADLQYAKDLQSSYQHEGGRGAMLEIDDQHGWKTVDGKRRKYKKEKQGGVSSNVGSASSTMKKISLEATGSPQNTSPEKAKSILPKRRTVSKSASTDPKPGPVQQRLPAHFASMLKPLHNEAISNPASIPRVNEDLQKSKPFHNGVISNLASIPRISEDLKPLDNDAVSNPASIPLVSEDLQEPSICQKPSPDLQELSVCQKPAPATLVESLRGAGVEYAAMSALLASAKVEDSATYYNSGDDMLTPENQEILGMIMRGEYPAKEAKKPIPEEVRVVFYTKPKILTFDGRDAYEALGDRCPEPFTIRDHPQLNKCISLDHTFRCAYCKVGMSTSKDVDGPVICPGCGPCSEVRYCQKSHLLADALVHARVCGKDPSDYPLLWEELPHHWTLLIPYIRPLDRPMTFSCFRQMVYCSNIDSDGIIENAFKAYFDKKMPREHKSKCRAYVKNMYPYQDKGFYYLFNPSKMAAGVDTEMTINMPDGADGTFREDQRFARVRNACFLTQDQQLLAVLYRRIRDVFRGHPENEWKDKWYRIFDQQIKAEFPTFDISAVEPIGPDYSFFADWRKIRHVVHDLELANPILRAWITEDDEDPNIPTDPRKRYQGMHWDVVRGGPTFHPGNLEDWAEAWFGSHESVWKRQLTRMFYKMVQDELTKLEVEEEGELP